MTDWQDQSNWQKFKDMILWEGCGPIGLICIFLAVFTWFISWLAGGN